MIERRKINDFFEVHSGDYHALTELDSGDIPLISCGDLDNGLVGYFEIPTENIYENAVTVAYNGRPLTAKYHPYKFGAKDDVAVLVPRTEMEENTLLYVAAQLNNLRWRYSYGRKCFKAKLQNLKIPLPVLRENRDKIDQAQVDEFFSDKLSTYIPEPRYSNAVLPSEILWKKFPVSELFEIERGDFHSIADLDPGGSATISRVTTNNGLVGYFEKPDGAVIYPGGQITVSTVGGDAFVQTTSFIATDNVLICLPRRPMKVTTLFFIAFVLNKQKWRYSYGRQPYKAKFERSFLSLPVSPSGEINEDLIAQYVHAASYWPYLQETVFA